MTDDDLLRANLLAKLDQVYMDDKYVLGQYVAVARKGLKDKDAISVWTVSGNAMLENYTRSNITVNELIILLTTAIVELAQVKEKE